MQSIYLSYKREDEAIAVVLKDLLKSYNYIVKIDEDKFFSDWRREMMQSLRESNVVVPIYTEKTFESQYVPYEIGMATAYKDAGGNIFVIPLLVNLHDIPPFIENIIAIKIKTDTEADLKYASDKIHNTIQKHLSSKKKYPKIFVSHRHKDEKIAKALVEFLESAFNIQLEDMRCTSVQPYKLPPGGQTSQILKDELNNAEVVLGLISPDVDESQYVLFELGAAWGLNTPTFPLLAGGADAKSVPGPLSERHSISLTDQKDWQLIEALKNGTTLEHRDNNNVKISSVMQSLVETAKGT